MRERADLHERERGGEHAPVTVTRPTPNHVVAFNIGASTTDATFHCIVFIVLHYITLRCIALHDMT